MRRFWQPVCYSDELKELPLKLRILGEDLITFPDGSGAVGLPELHCPHRGTSLEFGAFGRSRIRRACSTTRGVVIPTYCNDTVVRIPPTKTPDLGKKLMRETGGRLATLPRRRF